MMAVFMNSSSHKLKLVRKDDAWRRRIIEVITVTQQVAIRSNFSGMTGSSTSVLRTGRADHELLLWLVASLGNAIVDASPPRCWSLMPWTCIGIA